MTMKEMILDDLKTIKKYDGSDMLKLIESFSDQCEKAAGIGNAFELPVSLKADHKNIVFTGLGGSAIGADIIRSYLADEVTVPILVNRNYALPKFVNNLSLVVVSSYSGNTEETLSAYKDAKAKQAKIVAITSGGELEKLAKTDGFPVLKIPGGLPPRCALGYSFFPALILLSKIGLIKDQTVYIDETIKAIRDLKDKELGHDVPSGKNRAKDIAGSLYQKYPIIYSGQDHFDCAATRWRGQLAENSKTLSSTHVLPEMNHNEIVGWENPKGLLKDFVVIILRDAGDPARIARRMDIIKNIISGRKVRVIEVNTSGNALLTRIFSLIYTGDLVSFYLAILNQCDPTPVESIVYLKEELGKG
jgi:glucose/mannose-6-phosphate isomerase